MYVLKGVEQHREKPPPAGAELATSCQKCGSASAIRGELRYVGGDASSTDEAVRGENASRGSGAQVDRASNEAAVELQALIYLDSRALTRDCVGRWLQSSLRGFSVCLLPDAEQIPTAPIVSDQVSAVIINTGPERMSSGTVAAMLSRVGELLPAVPVAVLSDYEDPENIREAFELGVRGYIPTSLASMVAVGAMHLVCLGGTFAPAAALLSESGRPQGAAREPLFEGFTQRQAQILDCLRRGMANKLIAYELSMCESTVKVHVRNIMKKLKATNRTQVVYLTRGLFEGAEQYQRA
jgi:DNA-binding NarL/FixJ family response regulator